MSASEKRKNTHGDAEKQSDISRKKYENPCLSEGKETEQYNHSNIEMFSKEIWHECSEIKNFFKEALKAFDFNGDKNNRFNDEITQLLDKVRSGFSNELKKKVKETEKQVIQHQQTIKDEIIKNQQKMTEASNLNSIFDFDELFELINELKSKIILKKKEEEIIVR
jgi:hypothetical protein